MSPKVCNNSDRVMVNPFWINSRFDGLVDLLLQGVFLITLSVLFLSLNPQGLRINLLNYSICGLLVKKVLDIVANNWVFRGYDSAQFCLKQKLKGLKAPLDSLMSLNLVTFLQGQRMQKTY